MLTVRLDEETEQQLGDILARENTNRSELIKRLIRVHEVSPLANRWLALQAGRTLLERRGGHPQHLLQDASPDLSERPNRKAAMPEAAVLRYR